MSLRPAVPNAHDDYFVSASQLIELGQLDAARRRLEAPALRGKSDAQLLLGYCHDMRGPAGREDALRWYRRAVAQGESSAAVNIATMYRDAGRKQLARVWYWRAFKMGMPESLLDLSLLVQGKRRAKLLRRLLRYKSLIPAVEEQATQLLSEL